MKTNIKNDLSTLTTINESTFSKLETKIEWCISDVIEKAIKNGEDTAEVDFGIGILYIKFSDSIRYKFVPSQKLEKIITNTVVNERNDLVVNVENTLISKLNNVYKTFF